MGPQIVYAQSEPTDRLNFSPINIEEDDEGLQIDWHMPETALDDPSEFQFSDWFWDNYSGYSIPITTITVILRESKSTKDLAIDIALQEDIVWENDIPLAEVEVMLSVDGEELPNMQPLDLELPTEPIFVLRRGRIRGTELIIIGVSPIYAADGAPRVVTKIDATISGAMLFDDDKNDQPASPLAVPGPEQPEPTDIREDEPSTTLLSPLVLPSATAEAGMASPLSSPPSARSLAVQQTATAEATVKSTRATATPKPTATKRATRTPTKEATTTPTDTVIVKSSATAVTATTEATATTAATVMSIATPVATALNVDKEMISPLAEPDDDTKDSTAATAEVMQPTTAPTIILLNRPEPDRAVATATLVAINESVTLPLSTTVSTEPPTEIVDNVTAETAPKNPTEQIWSLPRYISRTWLVLPIFLTFIWGILFVFTRKSP